jgi:antitoxin ParD1/3/4
MTTMNISVPEDMKSFVESQMAQEGYASASEYLRALIRDAQKRRAKEELEAKLMEGLHGPTVKMSRKDWTSLEREARKGLAGESIRR